jgi:hypothetical protein
MINPPTIAVGAGCSPYPMKTHTGLSTGSNMATKEPSKALTRLRPYVNRT